MKYGVFDQLDWAGGSVMAQYQERLSMAQLYEALGFYCYQMSEHHGTPLSTTPSPSVYLAALSQRTSTLRFGPLVYLLPAYSPLRLAEEIGMLDNLSAGRFEFGVGRGASSHEMAYFGVAADQMQSMYTESLEIIRAGLMTGILNADGPHWRFDKVELSVTPVQKPLPPMWAAISSPDSALWSASHGVNIIVGAPAPRAREIFLRYLQERTRTAISGRLPLLGLNRYILVSDSAERAMEVGRRAWKRFYSSFIKLWKRYGTTPGNQLPSDFDALVARGTAVVGSAQDVLRQLTSQIEASGANFLSCSCMFGDLSSSEVRHSVQLFASEVMPVLNEVSRSAHDKLMLEVPSSPSVQSAEALSPA